MNETKIYVQHGLRSNQLHPIDNLDPFDYITRYEVPKVSIRNDYAEGQKPVDDDIKSNLDYFVAGEFKGTERNNKAVITKDLIIIDIERPNNEMSIELCAKTVKNTVYKLFKEYRYALYPTVNSTLKYARYRLIIDNDRPMKPDEYIYNSNVIVESLRQEGLPVDNVSTNLNQLMGLPVDNGLNGDYEIFVREGIKYPVKEAPQPSADNKQWGKDETVEFIDHETALYYMTAYINAHAEQLQDYQNGYLPVQQVLAKAVQTGEIEKRTAIECIKMVSMGNSEWLENNVKKLEAEIKNSNITTNYTFNSKIINFAGLIEEVNTLDDLYYNARIKGNEKRKELKEKNAKRDKLREHEVADILSEIAHFKLIGEEETAMLYLYNPETGIYTASRRIINQLIKEVEEKFNIGEWENTYEHLKLISDLVRPLANPNLVVANNGIINMKDKTIIPFSPEYYVTAKNATNYNPKAEKPIINGFDVDNWIKSIANYDDEIERLLWQIIHAILTPNKIWEKIYILIGDGLNGKGTFQQLVKNLLGMNNISALLPDDFKDKFMISSLIGKVANIGDDIPPNYIGDPSNLMSIVTGDTIQIDRKYKDPMTANIRIGCMFSANKMPNSANKSNGWYRRILPVPFTASFRGKQDKRIKEEYLADKKVLEYVYKKAIEMDFESFIKPKASEEMLREYKKDNDYITAFFEDCYIHHGFTEYAVKVSHIKETLITYMEKNNIKTAKRMPSGKEIANYLSELTGENFIHKQKKITGTPLWVIVKEENANERKLEELYYYDTF